MSWGHQPCYRPPRRVVAEKEGVLEERGTRGDERREWEGGTADAPFGKGLAFRPLQVGSEHLRGSVAPAAIPLAPLEHALLANKLVKFIPSHEHVPVKKCAVSQFTTRQNNEGMRERVSTQPHP
jgi:hypothetical protein